MPAIGDAIKLSRTDLTYFHQDTVDLVLKMQEVGWKIVLTSKGHGRLLAPDGVTTLGMSRNQDSVKFIKRGWEKYNAEHGFGVTKEEPKVKTKVTQKWPCPRTGCPKVFATERQLNIHNGVDHEGKLLCPEPDCDEMFTRPASLGLHRTNKHGYVSPTKAKRLEQKANRAAKAKGDIPEDVEKALKAGVEGARNAGKAAGQFVKETKAEQAAREQAAAELVTSMRVAANAEADRLEAEGVSPEVTRQIRPIDEVAAKEAKRAVDAIAEAGKDIETKKTDEVRFITDGVVLVPDIPDRKGDDYVPFIDERDSWVVDQKELLGSALDRMVNDHLAVLKAVGLNWEIRVWKEQ